VPNPRNQTDDVTDYEVIHDSGEPSYMASYVSSNALASTESC
jgi:hypothetical protein